ncbi:flagellar filament capping protein FliD [Jatrophihabitans telluris]|uniref:Flagellar hook-associated protein 2 n=1 Tax=Jatrophihabitans telluris TaxID=2038343 RepID=A0ABY4QYF0_9ACTN|nr:flagellar filament capping protein FliD [Jatrophihabitans telluris]UQX87945.1 flagellar filament capping protein FliD [Jatrophihabitans telluris]
MTSFSISGLSSGIDTSSVISQLMTLAAAPQNALKSQLNSTQSELSAYQAINTKMAALKSAADKLALPSTWAATTATASDTSIVASGSSTAVAGTSTTFSVTSVAKAQISTFSPADPANAATAANGLDLTIGSTTTHLALAGNSLSDVASAINSAGLGVRAAVVNTTNGTILQMTSTSTGAANGFSLSGTSATQQNIVAAQDATIAVGDPAAGGYSVSSSTNTFTDAIPGVTFTVSKVVTDANIGVSTDSSSISSAVQGLVSAANDALSIVSQATARGAILAGDSSVTQLTQKILGVVSAGVSGGSYATSGIGITATGTVTFDSAAFSTAYAKNPSGVQKMVQTSFSGAMSTVGAAATDSGTGTLTQLITADNTAISSLNKQITAWDAKLATQKSSLQVKYAAMEAALSKLKSQSGYLTSMFNSMNGQTSSSSTSSG